MKELTQDELNAIYARCEGYRLDFLSRARRSQMRDERYTSDCEQDFLNQQQHGI